MIKKVEFQSGTYNVLDDEIAFRIKDVKILRDPSLDVRNFHIKIQASEAMLNPAVNKREITEVLCDEFRNVLFQEFGLGAGRKIKLRNTQEKVVDICTQCGYDVKVGDDIVLIVNTKATDENSVVVGKSPNFTIRDVANTNAQMGGYDRHIIPMHKHCFIETAGTAYEYRYDRR